MLKGLLKRYCKHMTNIQYSSSENSIKFIMFQILHKMYIEVCSQVVLVTETELLDTYESPEIIKGDNLINNRGPIFPVVYTIRYDIYNI